jgi:probable addiction module antidote protein
MMKGLRDHKTAIIEHLKNNESFRKAYLNEALNEDEPAVVLSMLRDIVDATRGFTKLAKETGLARQSLYKVLSEKGNPEFGSVWKIVRILRKKNQTLVPAR